MYLNTGERVESEISLVIPILSGDREWEQLLPLILGRDAVKEIWLSVQDGDPYTDKYRQVERLYAQVHVIEGSPGRGLQINRAIAAATSSWIWVLHADTRFNEKIWPFLTAAQSRSPDALHYCDLAFESSQPLMKLNAYGARWRSQIFGMPFGDQGFFFRKIWWTYLGGFSETACYGEDHLFAWSWRQAGLQLQRIPCPLFTSSRKYQRDGWLSTTSRHIYLTWLQAAPEWLKLFRGQAARKKQRATPVK